MKTSNLGKKAPNIKAITAINEARQHETAGNKIAALDAFDRAKAAAVGNLDLLTVIADGFSELGERDRAISVLQEALQHTEPNETVLTVIGRLAQRMDMHEIAVKVFRAAISLNPNDSAHYVNLANSYRLMEKYDEAIELIQSILPMMPEEASLWNILATMLYHGKKDYENANIFYQEAYRLAPNNDQVLLNIANFSGDKKTAQDFYQKAIAANPQSHEAHMGLALLLLNDGDLKSGWKHYEHRLQMDTSYSTAVAATNKLRPWNGGDLKNKCLLVMPEQGIGDEILFATNFPRLLKECKKLFIGCDPRLETIFKRSFPEAVIAPYKDSRREGRRYRSFPTIEDDQGNIKDANCAIWAGSVPKYFWTDTQLLPQFPNGFLKADPVLVEKFGARMRAPGDGPYIGLSWRSGNVSFGRDSDYIGLRGAHLLLRWFGNRSSFFCLQYGWQQDEIDYMEEKSERKIQIFDDVDLKDNIEANLAIMANLDVVIGPPIATQQFAIALGRKTKMIVGGAPWWNFGKSQKECPDLAPHSQWFQPSGDNFEVPIKAVIEQLHEAFPNAKLRT